MVNPKHVEALPSINRHRVAHLRVDYQAREVRPDGAAYRAGVHRAVFDNIFERLIDRL